MCVGARMLQTAAWLILLSATPAAVEAQVSDHLLASLIGERLRLSLHKAGSRNNSKTFGMPSIWIETALDNVTHDESIERERTHLEDLPHHHPQLQRHFAQLDVSLARFAINHPYQGKERSPQDAAAKAFSMRIGSIAVDLVQQAFYWRVASSPAIRHICEVGFNAGHSAVLWLSANPTATLETFDIFSNWTLGYMNANLAIVQQLFPGRVTAHIGDSLMTIPASASTSAAQCDLVHVDGRHSYGNVVLDTLNFMRRSHRRTLYLFDDQCDAASCSGSNVNVAVQPTLATCDMVAAGVLEPVAAIYEGVRQFALFQENSSFPRPARSAHFHPKLPCEFCELKMSGGHAEYADKAGLRGQQRELRRPGCQIPQT